MARHDRHVLEVALATLIADRAIVRVVGHEPADHRGSELLRFGIVDGDPHSFRDRSHTGHDDHAVVVLLVAELFDRALAAGAHRAERRVPAEVGKVVAEVEDSLQQVLSLPDLVLPAVDVDGNHSHLTQL